MFETEALARPAEERLMAAAVLPPGPGAIRLLADVDPARLHEDDRVMLLKAWERQARWLAAQQARAVAAVAGPTPAGGDDFAREQVRAALADCGGSPRAEVELARALAGPLQVAHGGLERGEMSYSHARVLAQETAGSTRQPRQRWPGACSARPSAARPAGSARRSAGQ